MKQFTSHIDYLIQKHDCVIIPDFGGFVLHREAATFSDNGEVIAPRMIVGFNPDLKYNDGLLAESYMNVYSISYDAACKKIIEAVNRLNTILNFRQPIQIGKLGKLTLDSENHISFIPNTNFALSYPETYGLASLEIKRLSDITIVEKPTIVTLRKRPVYQRILTGVGAAAAAVLVFFVTSTPVSENAQTNIQQSGFLTTSIYNSVSTNLNTTNETTNNSTDIEIIEEVKENVVNIKPESHSISKSTEQSSKTTVNNATENSPKATPKYYIIIGSAGSKNEAQNILKKFKASGYSNANIVNSTDRSRIYIAAFSEKNQAEKYLTSFKINNPKLQDAWVYTRR